MKAKDIENLLQTFDNFPKQGIKFYDISKVLSHPDAMKFIAKEFAKFAKANKAEVIVSPDARGFLFGVPAAMEANLPFVMVRKKGKLPGDTVRQEYKLEYGTNVLELQEGNIKKGQRVLVIDDIVAIGGTTKAIDSLVEKAGGEVVGHAFLFNLKGLFDLKELKGKTLTLFSK